MKLELEVLASTSIKRKKPWPRLAFLGEMKESVCLLDAWRLSILYLPSGKTKRKIPKLHPLLDDVVAMTHTRSGHFIVGMLKSGDVFIWHKDQDVLKIIHGLPDFAADPERPGCAPFLCLADDCSRLLVIVNKKQGFLWELSSAQQLFSPKQPDLKGTWFRLEAPRDVVLPLVTDKETSISAQFFLHQVLGLCCSCSFVFTTENKICVSSLFLRWAGPHHTFTHRGPSFSAEWNTIQQPISNISPRGAALRSKGIYVSSMSHDGQLLAVAVNQRNSHDNRMVFVSPLTNTLVVSNMLGSGTRTPVTKKAARSFWVSDMKWTYKDLFLVCILKQGTVCILSRLGEPLVLQTFGCSMDMGPKHYLPLHPLIQVQARAKVIQSEDNDWSISSDADLMRQRFSVAIHPRHPIVLCSDGYMVTVMQLPGEITCLSIIKGLAVESDKHLRKLRECQKLRMTLFDTLRAQGKIGRKTGGTDKTRKVTFNIRRNLPNLNNQPTDPTQAVFRFEQDPADDRLNETQESDIADFASSQVVGADLDMSGGRILFGDVENLNTTLDVRAMYNDDQMTTGQHLIELQKVLVLAWSLAASHVGLWAEEHELAMEHILHNINKMFHVILTSDDTVLREHNNINRGASSAENLSKLTLVLNLYKLFLHLSKLDAVNQHLLVSLLRLVHGTICLLLGNKEVGYGQPRLQTLHGCYSVLQFTESELSRIYTLIPGQFMSCTVPDQLQQMHSELCGPVIMCTGTSQEFSEEHTQSKEAAIRNDRWPHWNCVGGKLAFSWKLLYRHVAQLYVTDVKTNKGRHHLKPVLRLVAAIQVKLLGHGQVIPTKRKAKVTQGTRLGINGHLMNATDSWVQQLVNTQAGKWNGSVGQGLLHSVLYTLLLRDELRPALELIEFLIRHPSAREALTLSQQPVDVRQTMLMLLQDQMVDLQTDQPPVLCINNKAVRVLVQSMARIMAAYFTNRPMYVFPPHAPKRVLPLHTQTQQDDRMVPLFQETITSVISQDGLSSAWTPDRTLDLLLLAGLLPEAVWLAHTLGDWKAAFMMGVACQQHQQPLDREHQGLRQALSLPDQLQPSRILQEKLSVIFQDGLTAEINDKEPRSPNEYRRANSTASAAMDDDLEHLTKTLQDLLLGGTMGGVDVVPFIMRSLSEQLKSLCKKFPPFVPEGFYLPAPPVYCPQPPITKEEQLPVDAVTEWELRGEVSTVMQLLLLLLEATHSTLDTCRWYSQQVHAAWHTGQNLKAGDGSWTPDIPVLQDYYLPEQSLFAGLEENESVQSVLSCFRDLTALMWMLQARDELSLNLRQKAQMLQKKSGTSRVKEADWLDRCQSAFEWAEHMMPFMHFLDAEGEVSGTLLSLLLELPHTLESAHVLAHYFHDLENLDPEIQERVRAVLVEWNNIFLDEQSPDSRRKSRKSENRPLPSPRGATLSTAFHKYVQQNDKEMKRRRNAFGKIEQFVFTDHSDQELSEPDGLNYIGSRSFESDDMFLKFLDTFYAVCFNRAVEEEHESQTTHQPLLQPFASTVRERELSSVAHQAATNLQKKQALVQSPRREKTSLRKPAPPEIIDLDFLVGASPKRNLGLFRSKSVSDIRGRSDSSVVADSQGLEKRYSSDVNLAAEPMDKLPPPARTRSSSLNRVNRRPKRSFSTPETKSKSNQGGKIKRSLSSMNSPSGGSEESLSRPVEDGPLAKPLIPTHILTQLKFQRRYKELEQLMEWLVRWSGKQHLLSLKKSQQGTETSTMSVSPAMRIRVHPQMVMHCIWLMENEYHVSKIRSKNAVEESDVVSDEGITAGEKQLDLEGANCSKEAKPPEHFVPPEDIPREDILNSKPGKLPRKKKDKLKRKPVVPPLNLEEEPIIAQSEIEAQIQPVRVHSETKAKIQPTRVSEDELTQVTDVHSDRTTGRALPSLRSVHSDHSPGRVSSPGLKSLPEETKKTETMDSTAVDSRAMRLEDLEPSASNLQVAAHTKPKPAASATPKVEPKSIASPQRQNTAQPVISDTQPAMSNGIATADELRDVVRNELRAIMEAQHQGILAMLGALNGEPVNQLKLTNQRKEVESITQKVNQAQTEPVKSRPSDKMKVKQHSERSAGQVLDHEVMNGQFDKSQTDDDEVSLLPSDGLSPKSDGPMSMQDLKKSAFPDQGHPQKRSSALPSALHELNLLKAHVSPEQGFPTTHGSPPSKHGSPYPPGPRYPGKENVLSYAPQFGAGLQQQVYHTSPSPMFAGAMRMLDMFNKSLGVNHPAGHAVSHGMPANMEPPTKDTDVPRMPLLQIHNTQQASHALFPNLMNSKHSLTKKVSFPDLAQESASGAPEHGHQHGFVPFPLLRLPMNDGKPRLVPPHMMEDEMKPVNREDCRTQKRSKRREDIVNRDIGASLSATMTQTTPREEPVAPPSRPQKTQEIQAGSGVIDTEEPVPLHDGYAFKPGTFDEYLDKQHELGSAADNSAKLHYKAVKALSPRKGNKKDVAVETEERSLTREMATATVMETGTSPISEAIEDYRNTQARVEGNILAPNIFMDLKFQDASKDSNKPSSPRSFISVVDIQGAALDNIMSQMPEKKVMVQQSPDPVPAPHISSKLPKGILKSESTKQSSSPERQAGPDAVTARLLEDRPLDASIDELVAADMATKGYRYRTKSGIRKRLGQMNDQISAINHMSAKMEAEFQNTRLLMNTVENMAEAMEPDREQYPPSRALEHVSKPGTPGREQQVVSQRERGPGVSQSYEDSQLEITGLSGVSDVVAELVAKGDVDATEAGLSSRDMEKLTARARQVTQGQDVRLSNEQLREIFSARSPRRDGEDQSEADRRKLQEWMDKKRAERMRMWRKERDETREHERRPYKDEQDSMHMSTLKELQEAEMTRSTKRHTQHGDNIEKRKHKASQLMGEILSEKVKLPKEPPPSPKQARKVTRKSEQSPRRSRGARSQPISSSPVRDQRSTRYQSPHRTYNTDADQMYVHPEDYLSIRDSWEHKKPHERSPERVRSPQRIRSPQRSQYDHQGQRGPVTVKQVPAERYDTGELEGRVGVYDLPERDRQTQEPVRQEAESTRYYKPKPYTEIVRLQRPEVTRTAGHKPRSGNQYTDRQPQEEAENKGRAQDHSRRAQQRLYGTMRIPGSDSRKRTAPRVIKPYTQRLQEMKQQRAANGYPRMQPVRRPPAFGSTYTKPSGAEKPPYRKTVPRKTLTYAQQLQKLQPPKEQFRRGQGTVGPLPMSPKRTGPAHKTKTYTQQLQELQPHDRPPSYRAAYSPTEPRRYKVSPLRSLVRSRPYASPYMGDEDVLSDLSPMSMDEDVRRILYDGEGSLTEPTSMGATSLDTTDLHHLAQDYRSQVDVNDLMDVQSVVSSNSVMSFIDWDQVDQLIADVN